MASNQSNVSSKFWKVSRTARYLGVSASQIRLLVQAGELFAVRSVGGQRLISVDSIMEYGGEPLENEKKEGIPIAIKARCSTSKQQGDLTRQVEKLRSYVAEKWPNASVREYVSIASGMNYGEDTFLRLVKDVLAGQFKGGFVVCTFPERILRFGMPLFSTLCSYGGCEVVCIGDGEEDKDDTQSLADDVLAVITHFSARKHGQRASETCTKTLSPECIKRMGELRSQNMDMREIHRTIVKDGFLDNHANKPSYSTVRKYMMKTHDFNTATGIDESGVGLEWFKTFVKKCCKEGGKVKQGELRAAYTSYCAKHGKAIESSSIIGKYLTSLGYIAKKSNGERICLGLSLA